ncbi:hypothetical protein Btru_022104 [Bulinus truncatus]|nr:hypothetical protein Btru_022104 [Bulinus truncatus]
MMKGWSRLGQKCYKLYTDPVSWATADRVCKSYGSLLPAPVDYWENEEIGSFVSNASVTEFWIGASRIGFLPNNNRNLKFSSKVDAQMWVGHWFIDQPAFQEGDCVSVIKDKKGLHKWKFLQCDSKLSYVCQRPVCSEGSFHCINGHCLNPSLKCDQFDDCDDGSDEIDCPTQCQFHYKVSGPMSYSYPNDGRNYPNNADCAWHLEGETGYNIELKIEYLSLENGKDEIILLEGGPTESNSLELKRLSGQLTSPQLFYSSNNFMILTFRSDSSGSSTGFRFTVNQIRRTDSNSINKLIATNIWREFEFPFYNQYQLGNQDYSYVIETENPQQIVTLQILDLDLAPDSSVIIRDGDNVISPLLSTLKGSYIGSSFILSSSRHLYISMETVRGSINRGIKIQFRQGCDLTVSRSTGYISAQYTNGQTCRFKVISGTPVTIKFEKLNLITSEELKILDEQQNVLQSYSVSSTPSITRVENGSFTVTYLSSSTMRSNGFNLTFSLDCPKLLMTNETIIQGIYGAFYGASFNVTCQTGSKFYQVEHVNKTSVKLTCVSLWNLNVRTSPRCQSKQE